MSRKTRVTNAVNLAFSMVILAQALIDSVNQNNLLFEVQDLKVYFRGCKYVDGTLKLLSQKPDPILIQQIFDQIKKICIVNTS